MEVEVELGRFGHDLESFGICLHEAVLDAVVDHLDEVAGTGRSHMGVAALRSQRQERRFGHRHRLLGASDHQAVPLLQAPDTAGGARVDQSDALAASWSTSGAVSL